MVCNPMLLSFGNNVLDIVDIIVISSYRKKLNCNLVCTL